MAPKNYLIGRGELLTEPLRAPSRRVDKTHPYEIPEARARLAPQLSAVMSGFVTDAVFAPNDVQVVRFVLHPAYVAKSYFPSELLRFCGLEPVGSRERTLFVEKHVGARSTDHLYGTSEMFVAGTRRSFRFLYDSIAGGVLPEELNEIREFEAIESFASADKLKAPSLDSGDAYELVVHMPSMDLAPDNRLGILETANLLGVELRPDLGFEAGDLWFLPSRGDVSAIARLADYTTVRVVRPMPKVTVSPETRTVPGAAFTEVELPSPEEGLETFRVAILDGGLPAGHRLAPWISTYRKMNPDADGVPGFEQHGLAVTSAFLFGPISEDQGPTMPPTKVAAIRILDASTEEESAFELYRALSHVEDILLSGAYDFVNLSVGPDLPIDDTDVHAWTAVIDDLLKDGATLVTVAVGNNGHLDVLAGNARVQVPSDGVNVLAVGAADRQGNSWSRALYSARGPGRLPGKIKPDIIAFGGSPLEYFHVLADGSGTRSTGGTGTSLAAPFALRQAVSVRALLGTELTPLAIRALLVHSARADGHDRLEVGWGKVPEDLDAIVSCPDGVARIVYQGEVKPGKYIRATVPIPPDGLTGKVTVRATFVFASAVDTQSPDLYTRSALEPVFRPDVTKFAKGAKTPKSRPFFSPAEYADEDTLRTQHGKWETVMNAQDTMFGSTLARPVFDIHYNTRDAGAKSAAREPLQYALIITIEAPRNLTLHADILEAYADVLVPIEPSVDINVPIAAP